MTTRQEETRMFEKIISFGDRKWVRIGNIIAVIMAAILLALMLAGVAACTPVCPYGQHYNGYICVDNL
jgi:hypothetical protein